MTQATSISTKKQLRRGKIQRGVRGTIRHLILTALAVVWLVPILWLVVTSFSTYRGINFTTFFPEGYTLDNYINMLFHPDSVAQFPRWFLNTLVVAFFNCIISTCFVLMVAYAFSCCRFKSRRLLQNLSVTVNLFPGVLAMIAVYFVLRYLNLTNSYAGLIMVYAGSSGLGYLICKGFFDTVPVSLREAAKLDGASEARIFFQVVIPMSRPILVYTIINSFMMPWTDFVMAKMILNSGISSDWTVAIGLYNMLSRTLVNNYFALFCAGGVLVSIPISILFVIMLISGPVSVIQTYFCIVIGQLFPAHRVLGAVAAYFISSFVIQILSFGLQIGTGLFPEYVLIGQTSTSDQVGTYLFTIMGYSTVMMIVIAVLQYLVIHYIMKKKINLL